MSPTPKLEMTYTVITLINALVVLKPLLLLLNTGIIPLDDLVVLAWKHRMKHAKLVSKEVHCLTRG